MYWDHLKAEGPIDRRAITAANARERDDVIEFAKMTEDDELLRPGLDPEAYRALGAPVVFNRFISQRAVRGMEQAVDESSDPLARVKATFYLKELGIAERAIAA